MYWTNLNQRNLRIKLSAVVFNIGNALSSEHYDKGALGSAVAKFNENGGGFALLCDFNGQIGSSTDRTAASVTLSMDDKAVTAHITMLETPYGNIASQLIEADSLAITPVITATRTGTGFITVHEISRFIFNNKSIVCKRQSDLTKVKNWLTKNQHANDLYKLKNDK